MAFKLSKAEKAEKAALLDALSKSGVELNAAIETYNDALGDVRDALVEAIASYNQALADAKEFAQGVAADGTSEYDEKSEKWQEGERGTEAHTWLEAWEAFDPEEVDLELPDPVEELGDDVVAEFDEIPDAAGEG